MKLRADTINIIFLRVEIIEAAFKLHHQKNKKAGCDSYRQPQSINKRITFIAPKIPECCVEIIFKHAIYFIIKS
jgi:hypothetical protein